MAAFLLNGDLFKIGIYKGELERNGGSFDVQQLKKQLRLQEARAEQERTMADYHERNARTLASVLQEEEQQFQKRYREIEEAIAKAQDLNTMYRKDIKTQAKYIRHIGRYVVDEDYSNPKSAVYYTPYLDQAQSIYTSLGGQGALNVDTGNKSGSVLFERRFTGKPGVIGTDSIPKFRKGRYK